MTLVLCYLCGVVSEAREWSSDPSLSGRARRCPSCDEPAEITTTVYDHEALVAVEPEEEP